MVEVCAYCMRSGALKPVEDYCPKCGMRVRDFSDASSRGSGVVEIILVPSNKQMEEEGCK